MCLNRAQSQIFGSLILVTIFKSEHWQWEHHWFQLFLLWLWWEPLLEGSIFFKSSNLLYFISCFGILIIFYWSIFWLKEILANNLSHHISLICLVQLLCIYSLQCSLCHWHVLWGSNPFLKCIQETLSTDHHSPWAKLGQDLS